MESPQKIAIVGGGIAAIACSWKLRQHNFQVDIYESDDRLGGHANSVPFRGNGREIDVDTGFIAMNEDSYPQFTGFLRALGVTTIPTDMSFGVSVNDGIFEWGSRSLRSFTGHFTNLFRPWFWRLLFDFIRFSYLTPHDVKDNCQRYRPYRPVNSDRVPESEHRVHLDEQYHESIGSYLRRQGYSDNFLRYAIIPMVAAPWCTDPEEFAQEFPAKPLIEFMSNNGLLNTVFQTLKWRSFQCGSKVYVDAFRRTLPSNHKIHLSTPVRHVSREVDGTIVQLVNGKSLSYDHVVLAVHANQALQLLAREATDLERDILSCFEIRRNICYLHSDTTLLPKRASAQMAWNLSLQDHLSSTCPAHDEKQDTRRSSRSRISITFDMNKLQAIPVPGEYGSPGRVLVTMNPPRAPKSPQSVHVYYHPLITSKAIIASGHLHKINGVSNISFAGAWMGWGFHEDGFASGAHAAQILICGRDQTKPLDLFKLPEKPHQRDTRTSLVVKWLIDFIQSYFLESTEQCCEFLLHKYNAQSQPIEEQSTD